jgi:hypothetical protein
MLVTGVVHDQVRDDPDAPLMGLLDQLHEVPDVPVLGQDLHVVGDVVPAVAQRRPVQRQEPDTVDAQPLQVVQPGGQALDVPGAVAVGVLEAAHYYLVEDGAPVPIRVARLLEGKIGDRFRGLGNGCPGGRRRRDWPAAHRLVLCHCLSLLEVRHVRAAGPGRR